MFLQVLSVLVAGFAGAGVTLMLIGVMGLRLPKWVVPIGAGAAMLGAALSSEYTWFSRTASALPEGLEIAEAVETRSLWRPWSYVFPVTERFTAVDLRDLRPHDETVGSVPVDLYIFDRWVPVRSVQVMVHCPETRSADDAIVTAVCGPAG